MSQDTKLLIVIISVAVIGAIIGATLSSNQRNACQAKGGQVVKTTSGHVCAKLEVL